jgi:hypothetical protein
VLRLVFVVFVFSVVAPDQHAAHRFDHWQMNSFNRRVFLTFEAIEVEAIEETQRDGSGAW